MESKDRLNALFEFATEGILITNSKGEIILANPMAEKQFGYDKDGLNGLKIENLIPSRFSETHSKHRNKYYKTPKPRSMGLGMDLFAKRKDATEFPVEVSLSTFHDNGEQFVIAFTIDITERKKAEDELKKEKEQAQLYLEIAPVIFLVLDAEKKVTLINRNGCEILGYPEEGILGKNWFDCFVPEEDKKKGIEVFNKLMSGKNIPEYENSILTHDGKKRIIAWRNTIIKDEAGKPVSVLRSGDDITDDKVREKAIEKANDDFQQYTHEINILNEELEKKVEERTAELMESQKLYNTIARNFPNGIIAVVDRSLRYVFVEGKELYGLGLSRENIIGGRIFEFTAPDKTEEVEMYIRKVFNDEKVAFEVEIGNSFYFVNGVPLTDIRGEISQALVVIENITEQKEAENSLMKALKKERELNEMKSRFVSLASHEFRTPLGTILSSLSLIEKYKAPELEEKRLKHIGRVKSSVQNLTHILDDFLSAGKLEEGEIQTTLVEFDIVKLAESIVQEMQMVAKEGQKIVFRVTGKKELVYLDSQVVRNIFNNLLSNAIKYSPPEKNIYLTLKFEALEVIVEIKDYGIGIPVFEQEHLFERFFRASNVINTSGTGLGLSIVRKYLELLNGRIEFESQLHKGTTFTVHLPKNKI